MNAQIIQVKCLKDNYAYLIADPRQGMALVIDPGSAEPVRNTLKTNNLKLSHILLTHHHYDHSGGITDLKNIFPEAKIGIHRDDASHLKLDADLRFNDHDELEFAGTSIRVIHLPCHTRGHVAFLLGKAVFTGDTLFTAGCGKFFEGQAEEMLNNLEKLKRLPADSMIYCGHEYTLENLEKALQVEPQNQALTKRLAEAVNSGSKPLVPASLELELQTNPFLRLEQTAIQQQLKTSSEIETLSSIYKVFYGSRPV